MNQQQHRDERLESLRTTTPNFLTKNFIEFLSIYGHFAGEELEDDENIANHYKYLLPTNKHHYFKMIISIHEELPLIERHIFCY